MIIENIQDTIKQYLDGTLLGQEKADFEKEIKNSEELAEEVRRFRQLRIFNKNKKVIEANALLSSVMAEIDIEPDYGKYEKHFKTSIFDNVMWRWLLGGLTVLLVVGGGFFYQTSQKTKALKDLSKTYLQPMENIIGFPPNAQTQDAKGMAAYDNKNYSEAITLLNYASKNNPDDNSLRLYLAISYLMQEQNEKAEPLLQELVKADNLSTIPAKWYLALSLMQRNQKTEAGVLLQSLESDTVFGNRAKEILKNW
jgi:tetratricopeptide (TPR) repeat protein